MNRAKHVNSEYFIGRNNQNHGPYQLEDLRQYYKDGQFLDTDLVWAEHLSEWIPLSDLPERKISATPISTMPPLPKAPNIQPSGGTDAFVATDNKSEKPHSLRISDTKNLSNTDGNDVKNTNANEGDYLSDELRKFSEYPQMQLSAIIAEVTSSSLITRTETAVVGQRSHVFNKLGILFKGVDIKETSDQTYQELMIKPDHHGPQKSIKCEESSFRASLGQRVALVKYHAMDYSCDLGMVNLSTGQKTWFVADLSETQKQVDSKNNFWYGLCVVLGIIAGIFFRSFWGGVIAFFCAIAALYALTPVLKNVDNKERALKIIIERIPKCLDALYMKYRTS